MQSTSQFLAELNLLGVKLWVENDALRYQAPKGILTRELLSELSDRKPEIITILQPLTLNSPIPVTTRNQDLPLSFAQQRLWFLDQLQGASPLYNMPRVVKLHGVLNIPALQQALSSIQARHEILRTNIVTKDGIPQQIIRAIADFTLPLIDLQTASKPEIDQLIDLEQLKPFDLAMDALFRATLLKLTEQSHILIIVIHHIVCDGWSIAILERELSSLYQTFNHHQDQFSPLADLPIQYADFTVWQRKWLTGEVLNRQLSYWQHQLANMPPVLELPTDQPYPRIQTFTGKTEEIQLPLALSQKLHNLSQKSGATLFMTLLAAFKALLHRYSGQEDLVVGTPIAGRHRQELESLIGFFVNSLVLRTDLSGNPSFEELLHRVKNVTLAAYEHQDLPFERLVEELQPERDLSRNPIIQVWFNMLNLANSPLQMVGLEIESLPFAETTSKFDLSLYVTEKTDGIELRFLYNTLLFNSETIQRLGVHFQRLLVGIVENPQQLIAEIALLSESERQGDRGNLVIPNHRFTEFTKDQIQQSIAARFSQQVNKYPDNLAIATLNHQWSYEQLNQKADRIAQALLRLNPQILNDQAQNQVQIALLFDHDAPMIAAILAVLKLGQIYVPLDASYPLPRLAYMLEDSLSSLVLTNSKNLAQAQELATLATVPIINIDELADEFEQIEKISTHISPDVIAYLIYTSGSTGQPKGVIQTHRNVLHFIRNHTNNLHIADCDRLTLLSPFSSDAAVMDLFGALLNGATLYPFDLRQAGLANFSPWLSAQAITIYHSTPTVYRYVLEAAVKKSDLAQIRLVVLGGEEVVKADIELYQQYFSDACIFVNGLGCTESSFHLQYLINKETIIPRNSVPVGYPFGDTEILLLNSAGNQTDLLGEIAVRSPHIALGYWRQPQLTQAVFLPDPGGNQRIYRTGDWGRFRSDGNLEYLGRKDFQVKIRGFRIELGEIEAALAQHPKVKESVAIADQNQQLFAYVVPRQDAQDLVGELRRFLQQRLPQYMIPAFVMLPSLPLTLNGKVDRSALPNPDSSNNKLVAPRDRTEQQLVQIWEELLNRHPIGIDDNFFDLGGHSLLSVRLVAAIETAFNCELPLMSFFQIGTIAELSQWLRLEQQKLSEPWEGMALEDYRALLALSAGRQGRHLGKRGLIIEVLPQMSSLCESLESSENQSSQPVIWIGDIRFSRSLGLSQPIYSLPGSSWTPLNSTQNYITAIAALLVEELLEVHPTGSYILGGFCHDGFVAMEVAHQLQRRGKVIALLILVDTFGTSPWFRFFYRQVNRYVAIAKLHFTKLSMLPWQQKWQYIKARIQPKPLESSSEPPVTNDLVLASLRQARENYVPPQRYEDKVILIASTKDVMYHVNDQTKIFRTDFTGIFPYYGWEGVFKGDVRIYSMPCGHIEIQSDLSIQSMGRMITEYLNSSLD